MSFADDQIKSLQRPPQRRWIKQREIEGRVFPYLEGWRAIAEANRIFGFAAWDRETVASDCIFARGERGGFAVVYLTRVRITVRAGAATIVREGCGSGDAFAATMGEAHERAAKAAETDATKRALSTFGAPFGLTLYAGLAAQQRGLPAEDAPQGQSTAADEQEGPLDEGTGLPGRIDKSALTFSEPKRRRDREHLRFVAARPCLTCGRSPSQAHHLRFAQPRALGRKVSDEFTVPLCMSCHQQLHLAGDEKTWWREHGVDPAPTAERLWRESRGYGAAAE